MLETTIGIDLNVKGDKLRKDSENAAISFAKRIEDGLGKTVRTLGLDNKDSPSLGGSDTGGTTKTGLALGLIAGGVLGILNMIADIPIITGIMKMFKAVLMLLFIPLIPILKPIMLALGLFMKVIQPIMMSLSKGIETLISKIGTFLLDLGAGVMDFAEKLWNMIKSSWTWTLDIAGKIWNMIKSVWDWSFSIAQRIWDALKEAWTWTLDIAGMIWNMLKSFWKWEFSIAVNIWNMLKSFWKWELDIAGKLWETIKDTWTWTLDIAGKIWNYIKTSWTWGLDIASKLWDWIKTQLGNILGGGNTTRVTDAIITPSGIVETDPNDYIIATKNPKELGSRGMRGSKTVNMTFNIKGNQFRDRSDIDYIKRELTRTWRAELRAAGR